MASLWAELRKHLYIDPPVGLDGAVYLGVKQHEVPPDMSMVKAKRELYLQLFHNKTDSVSVTTEQRSLPHEVKEKAALANSARIDALEQSTLTDAQEQSSLPAHLSPGESPLRG